MEKKYLAILACPKCNNELEQEIKKENPTEVLEGKLHCKKCSQEYKIEDGIPFLHFSTRDKAQEGVRELFNETPYGLIGAKEAMENKETINITTLQKTPWHLQEEIVKDKLILEAGCGGGHLYTELCLNQAQTIGLDQTPNSLRHIQKLFRDNNKTANLVCGNIEHIPFKKRTFDIITCMGVIHHTPDTQGALQNLSTTVKENGTLHLMLYHKNSAWNYIKNTLRILCKKSKTFSSIILNLTKYWQGETASQSNTETVFRDNIVNPITKSFTLSELKEMSNNCGLKIISSDRREIPELYVFGRKVYQSQLLRRYEKRFGWFLYAKLAHIKQ